MQSRGNSTGAPRVSIILPTYNRLHCLPVAVESVRAQTFLDWELILIDDGSRDGTLEWAAALQEPRLNVIALPENRGASAARNAGLCAARGEYIAFIDSDDAWSADKLARQVAAMDAATDFGASCTGVHLHLLDHGVTRIIRPPQAANWAHTIALGCELSPGTTLMVRAAVFARVGSMDETLPRFEDWDWLFRYTRSGSILIVPEPLAHIYNRRGRMGDQVALSTRRFFDKHAEAYARLPGGIRRKAIADAWLQAVANFAFEGRFKDAVNPFLEAFKIRPLVTIVRTLRGAFYVARGRALRHLGIGGGRRTR